MKYHQGSVTPVPEEAYTIPPGQSRRQAHCKDVTIVSLAMMVHHPWMPPPPWRRTVSSRSRSTCVRSVPLDKATVVKLVKKTHRLLVVDEDYLSFGMSGEIAAIVAEEALDYLDAPSAAWPC